MLAAERARACPTSRGGPAAGLSPVAADLLDALGDRLVAGRDLDLDHDTVFDLFEHGHIQPLRRKAPRDRVHARTEGATGLQAAIARGQIGVTPRQLLTELGYSDEEITKMMGDAADQPLPAPDGRGVAAPRSMTPMRDILDRVS